MDVKYKEKTQPLNDTIDTKVCWLQVNKSNITVTNKTTKFNFNFFDKSVQKLEKITTNPTYMKFSEIKDSFEWYS